MLGHRKRSKPRKRLRGMTEQEVRLRLYGERSGLVKVLAYRLILLEFPNTVLIQNGDVVKISSRIVL